MWLKLGRYSLYCVLLQEFSAPLLLLYVLSCFFGKYVYNWFITSCYFKLTVPFFGVEPSVCTEPFVDIPHSQSCMCCLCVCPSFWDPKYKWNQNRFAHNPCALCHLISCKVRPYFISDWSNSQKYQWTYSIKGDHLLHYLNQYLHCKVTIGNVLMNIM